MWNDMDDIITSSTEIEYDNIAGHQTVTNTPTTTM